MNARVLLIRLEKRLREFDKQLAEHPQKTPLEDLEFEDPCDPNIPISREAFLYLLKEDVERLQGLLGA